jgi:hypothetical protein
VSDLTGTDILILDRKGRLVVPFRFRAALGAPVTLTAGDDHTLLLVPPRAADGLDLTLTFTAPVDATTGRVLVPWLLRWWADLRPGQEVAVSGTGDVVTVLPWERCRQALAERAPGTGRFDPAFAALWMENAALRRRLRTGEEVTRV